MVFSFFPPGKNMTCAIEREVKTQISSGKQKYDICNRRRAQNQNLIRKATDKTRIELFAILKYKLLLKK